MNRIVEPRSHKDTKFLEPELRFPDFSGSWKEFRLNQITNYVDYRGKTPEKTQSGVFLVTAKNIKSGFIDYKSSEEFIGVDDYDSVMSRGKPQIGDVLLTTEAPLGNVAQIDREDIALAQRVIKFRGEKGTNNTFVKHYFLNPKFQRLLTRKAIGTTVLGIQGKVLHKLPLIVPTEKEQQKIAGFLSSVDKKIEQLTEKHRLLTEYKKGVMQQIFTQQIRFKDNQGNDYPEWEEKRLGDICIKKSSTIAANAIEESKGIFKIYGASGELESVDFYDEESPYVAIVKDGAGVGRVQYCEAESSVLGTLDKIFPINGVQLTFLYEVLKAISFEKYTTGSTIPHIYFKDYKKELVGLPIGEEQQKIANFLTEIDQKIDQAWSTLEQTKAFKKGLLQKMFV